MKTDENIIVEFFDYLSKIDDLCESKGLEFDKVKSDVLASGWGNKAVVGELAELN